LIKHFREVRLIKKASRRDYPRVLSILAFSETKKISVFCQVGCNGNLYFPKNPEKLLKDSIRKIVMINPRKDYNPKDINHVMLFMGAYDSRITNFNN
jgi:hypothetical protein